MAAPPEPTFSPSQVYRMLTPQGVQCFESALGIQRMVEGAEMIYMEFLVLALYDGDDFVRGWFEERGIDRELLLGLIESPKRPLPRDYRPHPSMSIPEIHPSVGEAMIRAVDSSPELVGGKLSYIDVTPLMLLEGILRVEGDSTTRALLGAASGFDQASMKQQAPAKEEQQAPAKEAQQAQSTPGSQRPTGYSGPGGSIATLYTDRPSATAPDSLGVRAEAEAFARVAASKATQPPLSIGVFGEWGSGKSFFMEKMAAHVDDLQKRARQVGENGVETAYHENVVQISFNAWHYVETNLWASLVDHIFRELDGWLQRSTQEEDDGQEKIEALYRRLSTSRMLTLDAAEQLIETRKRRQKARDELQTARRQLASAEAKTIRLDDLVAAVGGALEGSAADAAAQELKDELQAASDRIGLGDLQASATGLQQAMLDARDTAKRSRLVLRSLGTQFRTRAWFWAPLMIVVLILAPLVVPPVVGFLLEQLGSAPLGDLGEFISAASGVLLAATGLVVRGSAVANESIDRIAKFQAELDLARERRVAKGLFQHEQEVERRRAEVEVAEAGLASSIAAVDEARAQVAENASARLHHFIRGKVAGGDYAKHLGIIASIRRDFDTLAEIMSDAEAERGLDRTHIHESEAYEARLDALLANAEKEGLLEAEEIAALRPEEEPEDEELRFFQRIILYIDDLDRCPPEIVVQVLQACHLLLSFPLFIVVVAVDARWVSRSLLDAYEKLLDPEPSLGQLAAAGAAVTSPGASATPRDYLEKIFQIPYWVRHMRDQQSKDFVAALLEQGRREGSFDMNITARSEPRGNGEASDGGTPGATASDGPERVRRAGTPRESGDRDRATVLSGRPARTLEANPKSLSLTDFEEKWLTEMAPFAGDSPRAIKRFVNVYRLLRTSLEHLEADDLVGPDGRSPVYRAIITQLAIVTGAPSLADAYFDQIGSQGAEKNSPEKIRDALANAGSTKDSPEWPFLAGALTVLSAVDNSLDMTAQLRERANVVKRYSFSARPGL